MVKDIIIYIAQFLPFQCVFHEFLIDTFHAIIGNGFKWHLACRSYCATISSNAMTADSLTSNTKMKKSYLFMYFH